MFPKKLQREVEIITKKKFEQAQLTLKNIYIYKILFTVGTHALIFYVWDKTAASRPRPVEAGAVEWKLICWKWSVARSQMMMRRLGCHRRRCDGCRHWGRRRGCHGRRLHRGQRRQSFADAWHDVSEVQHHGLWYGLSSYQGRDIKFIYSGKATKFCKIFTLLLSYVVPVKIR